MRLRTLDGMLHVLGCISNDHDLRLVAIAALLCAFSCWTTGTLLSRARLGRGRQRHTWIAGAAFVFGAGVWSTHFVSMLAFQTGFPITYAIDWTAFSIIIAVALSGLGFSLMFRPGGTIAGGAIVGLGISAMHYVGMHGLRGYFNIAWSNDYVVASVLCAVAFGAAAALVFRKVRGLQGLISTAGLWTAGISVMHFTGMSAATLVPDPSIDIPDFAIPPAGLSIAVTAITLLIVALGQISAQLDRHLAAQRSGEAERQKKMIEELQTSKAELNRALHSANAANEAKSAFLATMSHELRTPLNAIIGFTELMQTTLFGPLGHPKYAEYVDDVNKSGTHLLALINDILDLSKLDAGKAQLVEEQFSLRDLISDVCRSMQPLAIQSKLKLTADLSPALPWLKADQRRVRQVVLNLVSNAVKFTPVGGSVTISAAERLGEVVLEVCDTGVGMSQADLPKALERFGQLDQADAYVSKKCHGTGLGLPLTKKLIEIHDGTFEIRSEPGVGTAVTITFPRERTVPRATLHQAEIVPIRRAAG
jgi:signal transduction histidine kinase